MRVSSFDCCLFNGQRFTIAVVAGAGRGAFPVVTIPTDNIPSDRLRTTPQQLAGADTRIGIGGRCTVNRRQYIQIAGSSLGAAVADPVNTLYNVNAVGQAKKRAVAWT